MVISIITVPLLLQQKTSIGSLHTRIIKRIALCKGIYINSYRTEVVVGNSLRLGLVSLPRHSKIEVLFFAAII